MYRQNENLLNRTDIDSRLKWINQPEKCEFLSDDSFRIVVAGKTDLFCDPDTKRIFNSASFLYTSVSTDFTARAHVGPRFNETYDAGGLLLFNNENQWIKLCYENTDLGNPAIVSVVNENYSDDANGCDLDIDKVWIQIARKGDLFALHYSTDGYSWRMVRYFSFSLPLQLKIGIIAQSPCGDKATIDFDHFSVIPYDLQNIRNGV